MKGHRLREGTLRRDDAGITAQCECGWSSTGHFSSFAASAAFSEHQEQELASMIAEKRTE